MISGNPQPALAWGLVVAFLGGWRRGKGEGLGFVFFLNQILELKGLQSELY